MSDIKKGLAQSVLDDIDSLKAYGMGLILHADINQENAVDFENMIRLLEVWNHRREVSKL